VVNLDWYHLFYSLIFALVGLVDGVPRVDDLWSFSFGGVAVAG
jgi:hypothetical protein